MEDPITEIPAVIHALTQSPLARQRATLETYFTPSASFTHPFCRTGSFANSRWLIAMIYRWYKIMSPRIELSVDSVAYDATNLRLYVSIHQVFCLWIVPFYAARVNLVTVLDLVYDKQRRVYLISSQNDLYQVNEFLRFGVPGGAAVAAVIQYFATLLCVLGAWVLAPLSVVEERLKVG